MHEQHTVSNSKWNACYAWVAWFMGDLPKCLQTWKI